MPKITELNRAEITDLTKIRSYVLRKYHKIMYYDIDNEKEFEEFICNMEGRTILIGIVLSKAELNDLTKSLSEKKSQIEIEQKK